MFYLTDLGSNLGTQSQKGPLQSNLKQFVILQSRGVRGTYQVFTLTEINILYVFVSQCVADPSRIEI